MSSVLCTLSEMIENINQKIFNINRQLPRSFSSTNMGKMTWTTKIKNFLFSLRVLNFLQQAVWRPIMKIALSEKYVRNLFQSSEKFSITSLHTLNICCPVEPLLTFGMSSSDASINAVVFPTCCIKMSRCLSTTLLHPSVAIPYHVCDNSSFRSSIVCLETTPVNMWVVFVWPLLYLLTILNPEILHKIIYQHGQLWLWEGCAQSTKKPAESSLDCCFLI